MYRWLLVIGVWTLALALGALFFLGWQALRGGVPLRLEEPKNPVRVEVTNPLVLTTPFEVRVSSLPLEIPARFIVAVEGPVRADTGLLRCPACGEGILLPVRISLFSGALTWRCTACDQEFHP